MMARLPRLSLPGVPQHIIQRGNNKQPCFFKESDYSLYLEKLHYYADECRVDIHSYVLMTNHVHLLATPEEEGGVSLMMQSLGRFFVRYINNRYDRSGTLWEGRFRSTLIDSERYLLTVSRYIELNPVRAAMVKHPSDYAWTSFGFNAQGLPDPVISPHACYLDLGRSSAERCHAYSELFNSHLSESTINDIRSSLNQSWVLGRKRFNKQVERQVGHAVGPRHHGGDRRSERFLSED